MTRTTIQDTVTERVYNANNGIHATSKEAADNSYVIFSVDNFTTTEKALQDIILAIGSPSVKNLKGSYVMESTGEKVIEDSFIINVKDYPKIKPLIENQESVLFLTSIGSKGKRFARLVFVDSHDRDTIDLGKFLPVSKERALQSDYWTFDPHTNQYYITEE